MDAKRHEEADDGQLRSRQFAKVKPGTSGKTTENDRRNRGVRI